MKIWTIILIVVIAGAIAVLPVAATVGAGARIVHGDSGAVGRALDYIKVRQQPDGGFAEPGNVSSEQLTDWVICAIASAGEDPASWRTSGKSPLDYLAARAGSWSKLTDLERNCLAVCSAGGNPRSFGGQNLVEGIKAHMAADGHIGDLINEHSWGVIALVAAGEQVPDSSRSWLAARQNIDGGFGYSEGSASDPDDTGATLQALMAAGESSQSNTVSRALSYFHFCHAEDGGFNWQSSESNVGSTSWSVQGLVAAGEDVSSGSWTKSGKTPVDYLSNMQQSDGHFKYSSNMDSKPVWMTSEVIPALLKKPFPLNLKPPPNQTNPVQGKPNSTSVQQSNQATVSAPAQPSDRAPNSATSQSTAASVTTNSSAPINTSPTEKLLSRIDDGKKNSIDISKTTKGKKLVFNTNSVDQLILFIIICAILFAVSVAFVFSLRPFSNTK